MSHKLQMYENLRDMLEREVTAIEKKNDLDDASLNNLYKLTSSLKVVDKCIDREKYEDMDMSRGMSTEGVYPRHSGSTYSGNRIYIDGEGVREAMKYHQPGSYDEGNHGNSYGDGNSYNDGYNNYGNSRARWGRDGDGDGQYNESSNEYRSNRYSRRYDGSHGYSRDESKKMMVRKLETLMDDTMSEKERQAIQDCISKIE